MSKVYTSGRASYGAWDVQKPANLGRQRWIGLGFETAEQAKAACQAAEKRASDESAIAEAQDRMYRRDRPKANAKRAAA